MSELINDTKDTNVLYSALEEAEQTLKEGHFAKAQEQVALLLEQEPIVQNPEWYVRALYAYVKSGKTRIQPEDILPYAQKAVAVSQHLPYKELYAQALVSLGNIHTDATDFAVALDCYKEAEQVALEHNVHIYHSQAVGNTGHVYRNLGDYATALEYYEKALSIANSYLERADIIQWLTAIGTAYQHLGKYELAYEYFTKSLKLAEQHSQKSQLTSGLGNMGIVLMNLKRPVEAIEYLKRALAIDIELGNKAGVARQYGNLGTALIETTDDFDEALEYYNKALAIDTELNNQYNILVWRGQSATIYAIPEYSKYNPLLAESEMLKVIEESHAIGQKSMVAHMHEALTHLYEHQERWKEYGYHLKKYYQTDKELQSEKVSRQTQMLEHRRKLEEGERDRQVKLARFQEQEKILLNILPAPIAERILNGEKQIADHCDNVSVFFSDIVGFTKLSAQVSPAELVEMLNQLFTEFDRVARKYGLEKIKTIGDAYMAVAGVPDPMENHAENTARFALEVMDIMQAYRERTGNALEIRVGLHTGSAVAGVIGENKFAYDLWGDAINTASRMESHGEPGKIQVSDDFRNRLPDNFIFEERGELEVKGKGKMKTWFLVKQTE